MTKRRNNITSIAPRKIAIWGYAEESRDLIYELDETYEVWGINMAHAFINSRLRARPTNWFQLHPSNWNGSGKGATGFWGRPEEHLKFLEGFDGTVWMQYPDEEVAKNIKNRKRFPLEQIIEKAGRDYLTSTFAYQFALIWYQHVHQNMPVASVDIYGVNLSATEEYAHQRPAAEYWIGRLEQVGIKVVIPKASSLMKGRPYARGADDDLSLHAMERLTYWKDRYGMAKADGMIAQTCKGEIGHWANFLDGVVGPMKDKLPEELFNELREKIQQHISFRHEQFSKLEQKAFADMNGALAMTKDNFHWLTVTGGFDHRATNLEEFRSPSSAIFKDWEMPQMRAI